MPAIAFERSFRAAVDRFGILPLPGVNEALAKLSAAGIKICLMSSLVQARAEPDRGAPGLGAARGPGLCADDVARGFPWPDLILSAVLRLGIGDVRDVVVATATEGGVLSAQRAGARLVVGVLSDIDDASRLRRAGATHLLADIGELPDLVASQAGITTSD